MLCAKKENCFVLCFMDFFFYYFSKQKMDIGNISQSNTSKGNKMLVKEEKADKNTKVSFCHKKFQFKSDFR